MWRKKKWMIISVLAGALVLAGIIGSVAYAQTGTTQTSNDSSKTLLARVATILGIDQAKLEDAFTQAQKETRDEALTNQLKSLVDQGTITQEQADQYQQWWQSRPDVPADLDSRGGRGLPRDFGMPRPEGSQPPASPTVAPSSS